VFREHAAYVWRALRRLGVEERDVEDVCQEVFMVVHRRRGDFEGRSSVRTWVYGVCVRTASDYRKRARHKHEVVTDAPPEQVSPDDPHGALAGREARAKLDAILGELDDDKRAVFVLHEIEQETMADVAEAVGCPLQTAYSRLHAARAKVEKAVAKHSLLEAGREERPTAAQLAAMAAKLGPIVGGAGAGAMAGGAAVKATATKVLVSGALAKTVLAATAVTVVGVAAMTMARAPSKPVATTLETTVAIAAPTSTSTSTPTPTPTATPTSTPTATPTPSAPPPDPDAEIRLLTRAQSDLSTDPARALAECDALARRFPHGVLDQEREVVAIDALVRLGRRDEATARATRFDAAYPQSTHARRIQEILSR
jgi:RNA polymerase sigma-70 factor (ECF subfamily)